MHATRHLSRHLYEEVGSKRSDDSEAGDIDLNDRDKDVEAGRATGNKASGGGGGDGGLLKRNGSLQRTSVGSLQRVSVGNRPAPNGAPVAAAAVAGGANGVTNGDMEMTPVARGEPVAASPAPASLRMHVCCTRVMKTWLSHYNYQRRTMMYLVRNL